MEEIRHRNVEKTPGKILIRIEAVDEVCNSYSLEKEVDSLDAIGRSFLDDFGETANLFLRHMGFPQFNKTTLLMESLTEEECEYVTAYLNDLRKEKE